MRSTNAYREERTIFTITDRAISPKKAHYEEALRRLPAAHRRAQSVAISHLHEQVSSAAQSAGLDSGPLKIGWKKGHAYLGIEHSPAGNRLFDAEYGTADEEPNPVLRTAAHAHHSAANALYGHHLRAGLGI